ncbi:MAG TPA: FAD-dependent oxidoreductase, partial [Solirubrobacteraceae bacterium]|nr:FAD-dependent oxidoreductase [Solirubrobacteraceae bacterium]
MHVVVVGGGFAGINAVKALRREPVDVTLVDRRNFHLFQPLTYQVATGALSAGEIAYPLRALFKSAPNVTVLMGEVEGFDLAARRVILAPSLGVPAPPSLSYDALIVAAGSA